jgi:hypothetical protein
MAVQLKMKHNTNCEARPVRKADNLTAIYEPIVKVMWDPYVSQPYGPSRPVTGIALLTFTNLHNTNYVVYVTKQTDLLTTPWPAVRKGTIPTEQSPLGGEVSANFCG